MIRNNVQYIRIDSKERMAQIQAWNSPVVWPVILILVAILALVGFVRRHLIKRSLQRGIHREDRA